MTEEIKSTITTLPNGNGDVKRYFNNLMEIDQSMWSALHDYLFVDDNKFSTKEHSLWTYKSRFNIFCNWFHAHNLPFNRQNFVSFLKEMRSATNPHTNQPYKVAYLNKFIALAKHLDKMLEINEMEDFTYYPEKGNRPKRRIIRALEAKALAEEEIDYKKFKKYINQRQKALIYFLHTTGARIDEALSLEWSDIYTEPFHVYFRDTKNGEDRAVPIGEKVYNLLMNLPRISQKYVFVAPRTANKLRGHEINEDLKRRIVAIGLKDVHIHNHLFRHSFITIMLESGAELSDVSYLAGHKDPKSTMRYKNSLLDYYATVIYIHPLLQEDVDLEAIGERMLKIAMKFINNDKFKARLADHEADTVCLQFKKKILAIS